jgi:hypothetical protein
MAVLVWSSPTFLSLGDELLADEWLRRIKAVRGREGVRDKVHIRVRKPVSNADLRELIAFCFKYGVEMTQLAQFRTDRNSGWFCSQPAYWHDRVFVKPGKEERATVRPGLLRQQAPRRGQKR